MTSSQDEGGTVGGASAVVLDRRQLRKPTQRVRDLQEQLQAKVSSSSVFFFILALTPPLTPLLNPLTHWALRLFYLFCRPKQRRRGAPLLLCLVLL